MVSRVRFFIVGVFLCAMCDVPDCLAFKVYVKVPTAVVQGHKAVLKCIFDLEGDQLYSVKWYRGAGEFYRYTPSDSNPIKQFKIKGFNVIESESNATQVVLEHVSRSISGPFSCEVTADQPSFFTDIKTAELTVVELPKRDPYISGLKSRYRLGDILKANCTSEKSSPAANLAWYVNGQHVDGPHVIKRKHQDGDYVTSTSTLRLSVNEQLFERGRLKIRCSASMHHIYHRSSEKSVELEKRKHKVSRGWLATTTSTTDAPLENFQYDRKISPESEATLTFYSPINSSASSTYFFQALIVVPAYIIFLFSR